MEGIPASETLGHNVPVPPENFGLQPLPDLQRFVVPIREPMIRTFHDAEVYRAGPVLHLTSEEIHALRQEYQSRELSSWAHKDMIRSQLARAGGMPVQAGRDYVDQTIEEVRDKLKKQEIVSELLKAA